MCDPNLLEATLVILTGLGKEAIVAEYDKGR